MNTKPGRALVSTLVVALGQAACSATPSDQEKKACVRMAATLQACPASAVVQGIDVSVYQGIIAWPLVKSAGKQFAFARVSDGLGFVDSEFVRNWQGMRGAGLVRGAYQYFRAGEDPAAQADLVVSRLSAAGGLSSDDLPIVMDIETADGQAASIVRDHMATWLRAVTQATGKTPLLYTNFDTSAILGTGFASYGLWVANWGVRCPTMPAGWASWLFWQFSDRGSVPGIAGATDLDEFDGVLTSLAFVGAPLDAGALAEATADGEAPSSSDASASPAVASWPRFREGAAVSAGSAMGDGPHGRGARGPGSSMPFTFGSCEP
ncbi:MAG: hypothetical protein M3O36_20950 [Myxococcota bacterium]|nr:hypothetical protein [Myxococcota bacterium]